MEYQKAFAELSQVTNRPYAYNQRTLIYTKDKVKLYHYHPLTNQTQSEPVLVVFATVNRPEILDLFPEKSFIRGLLNQGLDVYLLDWGYPDQNDRTISFSDYVRLYLQTAVKKICQQTKSKKINLLGICQGGLISLCYTSIAKNINKLVLISTPIDFKTEDNLISKLLNKIDFFNYTKEKNILGTWLTNFFISLRPFELIGKKYLRFYRNMDDDQFKESFLQVEKWLNDAPDQPGIAFSEFVKWFYHENGLIADKVKVGNKKVSLKNIQVPVLNVMAKHDEIIPVSASTPLKNYLPNNLYQEALFDSGHIGIYVSEKVGLTMPTQIAEWLIS